MQDKQPRQQKSTAAAKPAAKSTAKTTAAKPTATAQTAQKAKDKKNADKKRGGGIGKFFIGLFIGLLTPVTALSVFIVLHGGNLLTFVQDFDYEAIAEPVLEIAGGELVPESVIELTIDLFNQLEMGMTYRDASNLIGGKGEVGRKSGNKTEYIWDDNVTGGSTIVGIFTNGRLSSKSQEGLDE